jgi:hypothetical protein
VQLQNYEQFAVYWTTEAGWNTELHLRNNLVTQDLIVTPSLRAPDGSETALSAVTVHPADVITVDLRSAIASAAPQLLATYGSIVFRYQAPVPRALYAAVMIELPGTPIEFHLDAFLQPYKWVAGSREGIWWQPGDSLKDYLVLTNTGDSAVDANLILYDPSGKAWQHKLTLGARQTVRLSVRSLLQQSGLTGSFGGIKIDASKGAGYLDSAHFVYDESSGFLALMKMFDHHPNATLTERSLTDKQWTIRAPMLALTSPDPALALPSEAVLQPTILLRNASPNAYTAQITFNWRSDATTGKSTTAVPLQPYETRLVDVADLQNQGAIPANARWAYVSITAPVKPDELLAVAASYDSTGHYGAQTPFTDQVANYWEGGKWEVDATHNTIIAVGNAGTAPSKAQLTFYHSTGTGKYQIEKTLAPDEQIWIDLGKLIGNQVADKNGKKIPTGVAYGTYELRSLTNTPKEGLFEGKLVVDKTYGHAAHGCMVCCGYPGKGFMNYDPFEVALQSFQTQYVLATNACSYTDDDLTGYYGTWWTGNTQVATASMNQITGVGVGSTSDLASGTIPTGGDWESRHCPNALDTASGGVDVEQLAVTSISPTSAMVGTQSLQITINGTGFGNSPTVNLPSGVTQTGIASTDTRIVVTVNISINTATIGAASLSVSANGSTSNSATLTLNGPNKMVVQSNGDFIGQTTNNPSAQSRFATYQVQNVDNTPAANIWIAESISLTGWNCNQSDPGNSTAQCNAQQSTDSAGMLTDEWGMYTGYTPSGCGKNIIDHWQWCAPAGSNPAAPNPGKTFGTLSGYIHTSDSKINGYANPPTPMPGGLVIAP